MRSLERVLSLKLLINMNALSLHSEVAPVQMVRLRAPPSLNGCSEDRRGERSKWRLGESSSLEIQARPCLFGG